jgi:hypothetical protein
MPISTALCVWEERSMFPETLPPLPNVIYSQSASLCHSSRRTVNFFADPFAVKELLLSDNTRGNYGLPLDRFVMLPLDITTPHELPFSVYEELVDAAIGSANSPPSGSGRAPLAHFTTSFLEQTRRIMLQFGKDAMELHDIVAIWCAMERPPICSSSAELFTSKWQCKRRTFAIERFVAVLQFVVCILIANVKDW